MCIGMIALSRGLSISKQPISEKRAKIVSFCIWIYAFISFIPDFFPVRISYNAPFLN